MENVSPELLEQSATLLDCLLQAFLCSGAITAIVMLVTSLLAELWRREDERKQERKRAAAQRAIEERKAEVLGLYAELLRHHLANEKGRCASCGQVKAQSVPIRVP